MDSFLIAMMLLARYGLTPVAWDYLDEFAQSDAEFALAATVPASTIGTSATTYADNAGATFRRLNHEMLLKAAANTAGLKHDVLIAHTAGKAAVCRFRMTQAMLDAVVSDVRVGWISSEIYNGNAMSAGGVVNADGFSALESGGYASPIFASNEAGALFAIATELTATGWRTWMQGGTLDQFGCTAGSRRWFPVHESFAGALPGTLRAVIESRAYLAETHVLSFGLVDNFTLSLDHALLECDLSRPTTHVCSLALAGDGRMIAQWQKGTNDAVADVEVRMAIRDIRGNWSAAQTIAGPGSGANRVNAGNVCQVNGETWCIYNTTANAVGNGWTSHNVPKYRVIGVDGSVGAEQSFAGLTTDFKLVYSPIYRLPGGRLLLPLGHWTEAGDLYQWSTAFSDDGGATWTEGAKSSGLEPTVAREPDGTLVAYTRSQPVNRWTSSDSGQTWSGPFATLVPNPDSRMISHDLSDGTVMLIGSDDVAQRIKSTAWIMGNGGAILDKLPLADFGPENTQWQNYPDAIPDGDNITAMFPMVGQGTVRVITRSRNEWEA